jgi:hypothetical protein
MFFSILSNLKLIAAVAALATVFGMGWSINGTRWENKLLEAQTVAQEALTIETERMQRIKDEALEQANKKLQAREYDVAATRSERDRLRQQLNSNAQKLSQATDTSLVEYTSTLSDVFDQCTREYTDLAAKADGHAIDIKALTDSWSAISKRDNE